MQYFLLFLEGIITFISPCLLPMLPIYISYFAGGQTESRTKKTITNALAFTLGFTVVFVLMGAMAGAIGGLLVKYRTALNIITGAVVIFFGLSYMGLFRISVFKGMKRKGDSFSPGFFSSMIFGMVFSIGWTPCVGAFLGSALMIASYEGSALKGIVMLLIYSAGLGIPFVISAILTDKLKGAFNFIKKNYKTINIICGAILLCVGVLMMTGLLGRLLILLR